MDDLNPLWQLIQRYMDNPKHRYPPKPADLARETGVSDQVISKWKTKATLPSPQQLHKFSVGTGMDYATLLTAALMGKGYLPVGGEMRVLLNGDARSLTWVLPTDDGDVQVMRMVKPEDYEPGVNEPFTASAAEGGDGNGDDRAAPMKSADSELSAADDELPAAAKEGVIEEPGEFNT